MAGVSKSFPYPSDLLAIAEALDDCEAEARSVVAGLSEDQVNWQPAPGSWSIAGCLDHLARTNSSYTVAMRETVGLASQELRAGNRSYERKGPVRPGWVASWFLRQLEPPVRFRVPAPAGVKPTGHFQTAEILELYVRSHEAVRALLRESRGLDLNRLRFCNPFSSFLQWTVGAGLLIIPAHERRHLWQMRQIREKSMFSTGPAAAILKS